MNDEHTGYCSQQQGHDIGKAQFPVNGFFHIFFRYADIFQNLTTPIIIIRIIAGFHEDHTTAGYNENEKHEDAGSVHNTDKCQIIIFGIYTHS